MSSLRATILGGFIPHLLAILVAAAGCVGVAFWAKDKIEMVALRDLNLALSQSGHDWANVTVDGLGVELTGTAPDEATRFAALSAAGSVVDASRLIDNMGVTAAQAIKAPDFAIEILRNEDGVSLIGLIPVASDPGEILGRARNIVRGAPVSDLLEVADFPPPSGWDDALVYGIELIAALPRSKISIAPGQLSINAVADSGEDRAVLERRLRRDTPAGVALTLDISAPRPVVAPFTFRTVLDDAGGRFDACTADSEAALARITAAANAIGVVGGAPCILGLGTPSTRWGDAVEAGLTALGEVGEGTLTISNADISLIATQGTSEATFLAATRKLEAKLPPVFSLNAILPRAQAAQVEGDTLPPEFIATRSPEGQVQIRGRLSDEVMKNAVESFAAAQFGADNVYPSTTLDDNVPTGWSTRVMAALQGLGHLKNGTANVTESAIELRGNTGNAQAQGEITRLFNAALGGDAVYTLDITYQERLDPLASLPSPEECIAQLNAASQAQKITFAPSSSTIESEAQNTIDALAEILKTCQDMPIEIGGHTDSQGRESMNQQLSQARADAVLNAIMARRVLVSNLSALGYGESQPIADNGTEEGREANRRIEFRLLENEASEEDTDESSPETEEESTE